MRTFLNLLRAFSIALLSTPAWAQQPQPLTPLQAAARSCNSGCAAFLSGCLRSAEGRARPEICDTGVIACSVECDNCAIAFSGCVGRRGGSDAEKAGCGEQMSACERNSQAGAQNLSRPLIMFEGGDGSTIESAVVIKGAMKPREGIRAESIWISKNHPDWRKEGQALLTPPSGRSYDRIEYITPTGRQVIYFDITDFFGKY